MTLENYILNGPSVVIEDDAQDPWVSWQHHLDRTGGLRGGVDLVAAVGTPVLAPAAGILAHVPNDGSAGNSCRFYHDANAGWKDVFSHLDSYVGKSGQWFPQGALIAYSGDTGGVTEHLHRHLLDPGNVRRNPWDYFSSSAVAGGGTPITNQIGMDDMPTIVNYKTGLKGDNGKPMDGAVVSLAPQGILYLTREQYNEGGATVAAQYGGPIEVNDQTFSRHLDMLGLSWALWQRAFAKPGTFQRVG